MNKYSLNAPQQTEVIDDSLFAEMVLDKALRDFQKEQILKEIDLSLSSRNKEQFYILTEKLQKFLE
ncbi:IDEAL domain-containing protein [Niallia endozanthoxylica]|uniref:IDEAL domain-containing protein n=1 Tax=Niallia endozanthoxylica TaxID=2036016 RepID=A0A5J5HCS1_9BACI|nr:IDEAL domain-containing protein [Niallia endozanthoxylica]KAA9017967.1 IDEAL domain-containing protein [Niallia endozanthoxylica]